MYIQECDPHQNMTDNSHPHQEIISTTEKDNKHLEKEGGQEKKKMKNDIE